MVQSIAQILSKQELREPQTQQQLSLVSQQRTMVVKGETHNRETFLETYNPTYQMQICTDVDECFFGDYPTLSQVKAHLGNNAPKMWLIPQLYNLSEYCGVKEKLQGTPLEECAFVIASTYFYMKVSELMLFFYRFKQGKYGRFYGNVDPLIITTALSDFAKERWHAIERREQEERERQWEKDKKNAISWEEYCRRTGQEGKPHPLLRI